MLKTSDPSSCTEEEFEEWYETYDEKEKVRWRKLLGGDEDDSDSQESLEYLVKERCGSFCEVCDRTLRPDRVTWYDEPHSYRPEGTKLYSACEKCIQQHGITGICPYPGYRPGREAMGALMQMLGEGNQLGQQQQEKQQ